MSCIDTLAGNPLSFNYVRAPASETHFEMIEHVRNESKKTLKKLKAN